MFKMVSSKRKLTNDEVEDILSVVQLDSNIPFDISMAICENVRDKLKVQLEKVQIYPEKISELKSVIEKKYWDSIVEPGEMVGCLAAASIGEQTTQQSLNSFHSAGIMKANLTTGVVRLKELLNCSQNIKSPSNTIHLLENNTDLYTVKRIAESNFKYYDVGMCLLKYDIHFVRKQTIYEKKYYKFFNTFYNKNKDGLWSVRLYFNSDILYRIQKSLEFVSNCILSSYKDVYCVFFPDNKCVIDLWFDEDIANPEDVLSIFKKTEKVEIKTNEVEEKKVDNVNFLELETVIEDDNDEEMFIEQNINTESYTHSLINDENKMYFYLKNVVVPNILTVKVSGIKNIEECYYTEGKGGKWFIQTKGSNFEDLLVHPLVDYKTLFSFNMWDVYRNLGVSATREFLKFEFDQIIKVSNRHLDILISSMLVSGKILSVSRYGMNNNQSSIFAKVAFEQPFDHFFNAATNGEVDNIQGVSAAIMVGKMGRMGTGMIDVMIDTNKLISNEMLNKQKRRKTLKVIVEEKYNVDNTTEDEHDVHNVEDIDIEEDEDYTYDDETNDYDECDYDDFGNEMDLM